MAAQRIDAQPPISADSSARLPREPLRLKRPKRQAGSPVRPAPEPGLAPKHRQCWGAVSPTYFLYSVSRRSSFPRINLPSPTKLPYQPIPRLHSTTTFCCQARRYHSIGTAIRASIFASSPRSYTNENSHVAVTNLVGWLAFFHIR